MFNNNHQTSMRPSQTGRPRGAEPGANTGFTPGQPGGAGMPQTPAAAGGQRRISEVLFGDRLYAEHVPPVQEANPLLALTGTDGAGNRTAIPISAQTLGKHIMLLGGIGTGKTNAFNQILARLRDSLGGDSVVIIFDTKGDFYRTFYRPGDVVISNDETACDSARRANYWNIFRELDGSGPMLMENIVEISKSLFAEACEKTNQPFFPNAARDIFTATLWHFIVSKSPLEQTNRHLSDFLFSASPADLRRMLMTYPRFRAMVSYIQNDNSAQTQGVLAELQQVVRQIFIGNFNKHGTLGLRALTREKGGRFIFVEYDLSIGSMLGPVYTLMYDLAIKESICRERTEGNVFFVVDEFRLLPNLMHIDDAVNFGRSLGVKFMIGVQNVEQIYDNYGQERARSIMSGFLMNIVFRVNDSPSRQHVKDIFGKNRKKDSYSSLIATKGLIEETREGQVVEDWDITDLDVGQAIIGLPGREPFLFRFDYFDEDAWRRYK